MNVELIQVINSPIPQSLRRAYSLDRYFFQFQFFPRLLPWSSVWFHQKFLWLFCSFCSLSGTHACIMSIEHIGFNLLISHVRPSPTYSVRSVVDGMDWCVVWLEKKRLEPKKGHLEILEKLFWIWVFIAGEFEIKIEISHQLLNLLTFSCLSNVLLFLFGFGENMLLRQMSWII